MNERFSPLPGGNPFSTRFTAPGKAPFFFESSYIDRIKNFHPNKFAEFFFSTVGAGEDLRHVVCLRFLVDQFISHSCRGQIVGDHGSGKSSLLFYLKDVLVKQGYDLFSWSLHDQNRFLPESFWMELQKFLQKTPVLLPTNFLLPPPVMTSEEYTAQRREFLKEIFPDRDFDQEAARSDGGETEEEFRVSSTESASRSPDEVVDAKTESVEGKGAAPKSVGVFGFNSAGNFGGLPSGGTTDLGSLGFKKPSEPIKFSAFPDTETLEAIANDDTEDYDDVELTATENEDSSESGYNGDDVSQKTLEIPFNFDVEKKSAFFDRKILVFDGFEQLSFANRIIIRTFCRMNHLGLLLTSHAPMIGVPVLFRTIPSVSTIRQLLDFLLEDYEEFKIGDSEVETLLKNFHNDVREMLFSLYDAFESFRLAPADLREKIIRRYPR